MRDGRELVRRTKPFATESRARSWWHFVSTGVLFVGVLAIACMDFAWPIRLMADLLACLVHIRFFVLFHDHQHGALLSDSRVVKSIFWVYGLLSTRSPSIWTRTHDHHHRNNAKNFGVRSIGTYPVLTVRAYQNASTSDRVFYIISRHPLTIALGFLTVFLWGFCILPLLTKPRQHLDAAFAIAVHLALVVSLAVFRPDILLFAVITPTFVGSALGSYLFYAQHNCPGIKLRLDEGWDYVFAALKSSSFTRMHPVMHWFTGNIGYHHIHHLNARIPFYRLPETMAAFEELQSPVVTSLRPKDVLSCLRLKLWDDRKDSFVSFREARKSARADADSPSSKGSRPADRQPETSGIA